MADGTDLPPIDPGSLNIPPSPAELPSLYDAISIGPYTFPPVPGQGGLVRFEVEGSIKIDAQQSDGTDKATTKLKGVAPSKCKLTVEWTAEIWAEGIQFCMAISPNGPNKGKPFNVVHPAAAARNLGDVIVAKEAKLEVLNAGQRYRQSFDLEEWNPKKDEEEASTTTPNEAAKWRVDAGDSKATGVDKTLPKGFSVGSASAPKADP